RPVEVPNPQSTDAECIFHREGEYWSVHYRGAICRLRHRAGLGYLATLLERPHEDTAALTLIAGSNGLDTEMAAVGRSALRAGWPDDLGDVLDPRARAEYRERLADLEGELDEAERAHDV